jgi:hypothetical protein
VSFVLAYFPFSVGFGELNRSIKYAANVEFGRFDPATAPGRAIKGHNVQTAPSMVRVAPIRPSLLQFEAFVASRRWMLPVY